jgi:DNA polymerase-3 subunit epsilon
VRLRDLPVLVLDAQATGASPKHGSLLELGWATGRARDDEGAVRATWLRLPDGEKPNRIIRKLTGWTEAEAESALAPADAFRALCDAARAVERAPAPTVVHFARFEKAFLDDWHARFDEAGSPSPFDFVCLHAAALRLYPELPKSGLRALAGFLGHSTSLDRRAEGHVRATLHVWRTMVPALEARGIFTWEELRELVSLPAPKPGKRAFPMATELRRSLPDRPGVYRFLRSNGDILYIGKAASLKKRVAGHFTAAPRAADRNKEMLTQALGIDFTETATPLEAALLECDEIKRVDPPYNVQLRDATRTALFVSPDLRSFLEAPDDAHRLGPVPSRFSIAALGAVRRLVEGEPPTPELRGRAVGVPPRFAPDEDVFAAGWSELAARHFRLPSRTPWGAVVRATASLARLFELDALEPRDEEAPPGWDPTRVLRYLERTVLVGGQLLRRARWLVRLSESTLEVRDGARLRRFVIENGDVVSSSDAVDPVASLEHRAAASTWRARQATFDGAKYDRLRVLTTELRRVLAEGGDVRIRFDRGPTLGTDAIARWLRFV